MGATAAWKCLAHLQIVCLWDYNTILEKEKEKKWYGMKLLAASKMILRLVNVISQVKLRG